MTIVRVAAVAALSLLFSDAWAGTISLTTSDAVTLSAEHQGRGDRGVILVHGSGGDRSGWADIAKGLAGAGLQVVNVDLRGHGASKGEPDPLKMHEDVLSAAKYLRGKGVKHIMVVGTKLGGNVALAAAAADPEIESVVMISPALNASGVKVTASLPALGERKLLLIAGEDDTLSKKAVNLIDNEIDTGTVMVLDSGGSGMALVNRASDLETTLIAWGKGSTDGNAITDPKASVGSGDTSAMETTGTKLGERR
ncbi:MAG: alpha/beta hydrolase [Alphaproteobacteria bacterium]|nr:alpha/beta hydrolase [Alphaproteobacteria bacterium]